MAALIMSATPLAATLVAGLASSPALAEDQPKPASAMSIANALKRMCERELRVFFFICIRTEKRCNSRHRE